MQKVTLIVCCIFGLIISGCSTDALKSLTNRDKAPVKAEDTVKKAEPPKQETGKVNIDKAVVQMVNDTRAGYFQKAIKAGNEVYEQGKGSEKFLDTLAVAYGYKNLLEGLSKEETESYLKVVRKLVADNPLNRYNKIVLAGALVETGNVVEGNKIAAEIYTTAGEAKPKEVLDIYGWALYKADKLKEAQAVFQVLNQVGGDNLSQTYHTAVVMESLDKARALALYKRIVEWANNSLTWEENRDNLAATALINKIKKDAQDAINRIQLKGRSAN